MARKSRRSTPESRAEAAAYWKRMNEERSKAQAAYSEQERIRKVEEARKVAAHMARSPKTRAAEAQLLGEKFGTHAVRDFWPDEEQKACIRRTCLDAQREALRDVKQKLRNWPSEYRSVGVMPPADDLERRSFMRGAWWSIQRKLEPICKPDIADDQEGLFGRRR